MNRQPGILISQLRTSLFVLVLLAFPTHEIWAQTPEWAVLEQSARSALASGNLDKAEADFQAALKIADQKQDIQPGVVDSLCGLALVNHKRGNYDESERLYELAMRDMEGLVGPTDTRFADWMPDLAWLYNEHHKPDKAEVLFKRALRIRERNLGANDPSVASLLLQYAKFLRLNGRDTEAEVLETRAQSIRWKIEN
jgi:tetratricopeptide (TPR) repeat protein